MSFLRMNRCQYVGQIHTYELRYILEEDLPKASTVGSFFTMAWRFAIRMTPNARVTAKKHKAKIIQHIH
jgi:hypothetical protein